MNKEKKVDDMEQFTFRLPKEDLEKLRKASEDNKMIYPTPSHLIRVFIHRGLKWLEQQSK